MRVLITGTTGFMGTHVAEALKREGHSVVALSRDAEAAKKRFPRLDQAYSWISQAGPPPPDSFRGIDAIINLSGETLQGRWTDEKKGQIRDSRVVGTRHLVAGILAANPRPKVLISGSAVGYYGNRGDEVVTEDSSLGTGFLALVCRDWEAEAAKARALGVRVVYLRTGLPLGRKGGALKALVTLFRFGLGGPLGNGRQWWPWIHIEDVAGIILHAMASNLDGPLILAAPESARQKDLVKALGRAMRRPTFMPAPRFALQLALGEVAAELLCSRRAKPERALRSGYQFKHPNLQEAVNNLLQQAKGRD